ncbi:MAG: ABC transporter ATP-binding protein [Clostridia bacterium]|nr:ABC transporter ATP-binding protein [Clostridia bacterium]
MDELMIKIENVSKEYKLGQIGGTTLRDELQRLSAKIRHKEDPTKKIGAKDYNKGEKFMALNGVSFEVKKGERVGIIGHNGAGKSTLLKLLSRVTAPTGGTISLNGRIASMLEVGTGFHPELTGRENVYMNGAILGMTKKEIDAKMDDIIEFSEVRQFIDTPVKRYSSGMYVKLAFSVAAHLDSEIMIMDEVLAVGDMKFQQKCLTKMSDVSKQDGRTILYVSHNMNTIRQLCDRVVVLDHGRVIFDGDVEEGIALYMQSNFKRQIYYNYEFTVRSPNEKRTLQFLELNIEGKETNQFSEGEGILFSLKCKANETINNIGIRFEMFFADNSLVGTIFFNRQVSALKGDIIQIKGTIPTKNIAPGSYKLVALAYEYDEFGNQVGIERVDPAMFFEIIQNENGLVWHHQWWGHIHFDDLRIDEVLFNDEIQG